MQLFSWQQNEFRHFALNWVSYGLLTSKGGNIAFPSPSPPCNWCFCSSSLQKTTNIPTLNGGDRGGVWILLFSEVNVFE